MLVLFSTKRGISKHYGWNFLLSLFGQSSSYLIFSNILLMDSNFDFLVFKV